MRVASILGFSRMEVDKNTPKTELHTNKIKLMIAAKKLWNRFSELFPVVSEDYKLSRYRDYSLIQL